jgi:hypothetical protein
MDCISDLQSMPMIRRNLAAVLRRVATQYPVVTLTGPRQSVKTTLCRATFPRKPYVSLEPVDRREYAQRDPRGLLAEYPAGAIFDEIQNVPNLTGFLQEEVDARPGPGRFILTGSQQLNRLHAVGQSLAGRTAVLRGLLLWVAPPGCIRAETARIVRVDSRLRRRRGPASERRPRDPLGPA